MLLFIGTVYYMTTDQDRKWILTIPRLYFWSTLNLDLLFCFTFTCILLAVSEDPNLAALTTLI